MAICLTLGMSCSSIAAQQTLLASGDSRPVVFFAEDSSEMLSPTPVFSAEVVEAVAGLSPDTTLYAAMVPQTESQICTQPVILAVAAPSNDYAFDPQQFSTAAIKAAFTHDNMVAMARNFIPGQPLPNEPGYKPLTSKQKFEAFLRNAHSAGQAVGILSDTAISQATHAYPQLNPGMAGLSERFAITGAGAEVAAFIGGYAYPTLFHQDPRYFPSHQHGILNRIAYAASRALITRSDSGMSVINTSVIASHFTTAAIANAYVPYRNETVSGTIENALTGIGGVAEGHILDEFWPDITEFVWRHTHSNLIRKGMGLGAPPQQP